jgi:N-acyl-D-amino-acid deacylase
MDPIMRNSFLALIPLLLAPVVRADEPADPTKAAIQKSLRRIEQGAANYTKNRDCFSCHHQAMSMLSLSSARRRGFAVEPAKVRQQVEFTLHTFGPKKDQVVKGQGIPGGSTMAAYALFALEACDHSADETTAVLIQYLLIRQRPDGSWPALAKRPPTEGSTFTNNALALRALRTYGPARDAKDAGELRGRIDKAFSRGRDWLLNNKPENTEDKVSRLRGLVYAGADKDEITAARDLLLKEQRSDGSWAQLPEQAGDAYATGSALMALRCAGLECSDAAYQKALKYLLKTQQPDGSWIVQTRSRPVQVFFDNGDPGGKSQFISFAATNWAVLALLETIPPTSRER